MESPGEYLKREREQRGVSLDDIFKATRVPLKHLEALEADSYDAMPHPTFTKGYIRSYCKVLGVDENDAVLRYEIYLKDKAGSAQGVNRAEPRPPRPRKIQRPPLLGQFWGDRRNVIMAAIGAAAAVAIIVAVLVFGLKGPAPAPVPVVEQAAEQEQPPVEKEPVQEAAPPLAEVAEKAPEPVKAVPEPARMRHSLVVKAIETVWIEAAIDKGEPFDVTLKQGETIEWKAAESITLKIGNAGGVSISFNGKQLAPVGQSGYVVSLALPGGKVRVLARPEPEKKPEPEPTVVPVEGLQEPEPAPEPAPGVSIKELLPMLAPQGDVKGFVPATEPKGDVKGFVPATEPKGDVKGAAPAQDVKEPAPASPDTQADEGAGLPPAP